MKITLSGDKPIPVVENSLMNTKKLLNQTRNEFCFHVYSDLNKNLNHKIFGLFYKWFIFNPRQKRTANFFDLLLKSPRSWDFDKDEEGKVYLCVAEAYVLSTTTESTDLEDEIADLEEVVKTLPSIIKALQTGGTVSLSFTEWELISEDDQEA